MVQYYFNHKKKETIAVLTNCKYDAVNKIRKMITSNGLHINNGKYLMANQYKATVRCSPDDEYDVESGMKFAKAKLMEKYYRALDKRIEAFKDEVAILAHDVLDAIDFRDWDIDGWDWKEY